LYWQEGGSASTGIVSHSEMRDFSMLKRCITPTCRIDAFSRILRPGSELHDSGIGKNRNSIDHYRRLGVSSLRMTYTRHFFPLPAGKSGTSYGEAAAVGQPQDGYSG
jgi:hypothetical protein